MQSIYGSGGVTTPSPNIDYDYLQNGRYFNWTDEEISSAQNKETPLGLGTGLYNHNSGLLTTHSAGPASTNYFNFAEKAVSFLSAGYTDSQVFSESSMYIVFIERNGDGSISYGTHSDPNIALSDPTYAAHINYTTPDNLAQNYYALNPVRFDESMLNNPVSQSRFEFGDQIIATRNIYKTNGAEIKAGDILTVIRINGNGLPVVNSIPPAWLSKTEQTYFNAYTGEVDTPHEDNGFYQGETYSYVLDPAGHPVMVSLTFTIEIEFFRKGGGYQIYGKRKNAVIFSGAKIWANPYDFDSWIRQDDDWFQLNSFGIGSNFADKLEHNSWSTTSKNFEIGDTLGENETYICTLGFNKVPIRNPRPYGPTYYSYEYVDIHMPVTWSLE
jgi:hypothetical protein